VSTQSFGQAAAIIFGAPCRVVNNTVAASLMQRILLEVHVLVGRRDPRVSYAYFASSPDRLKLQKCG
jgi:hypothetical protein